MFRSFDLNRVIRLIMLNKRVNSTSPGRNGLQAQLRLGDLPTLLEDWRQAISTFKDLYHLLEQSIELRKQVMADVTIQLVAMDEQHSVKEMETIRQSMLAELRCMLNEMNKSQNLALTASDVERLHRHTLRLQEQNQRIQWLVN